jgi:hypothetical protein
MCASRHIKKKGNREDRVGDYLLVNITIPAPHLAKNCPKEIDDQPLLLRYNGMR